jgi:hypothetical protein
VFCLSLGGLDSQDQARSRFLDMSRPTFETCQDYPCCRDKIIFFSVEFVKIETFQSRLSCVEFFIETDEINWDCRDFWDTSRLFKIFWDTSTLLRLFEVLQAQKSQQIEKSRLRNMIKFKNWLTQNWNRENLSTDFLILIKTFGTRMGCWDKI